MARTGSLLALAVLLMGTLAGCDTSVDAFDPDDALGPYSVFGYLDATADTQFVRLEPLRDSLLVGTPVGRPSARVSLTNAATGETVVWRDSLFVVNTDMRVRNFFATATLQPDATYRFRAERPDGTGVTTAEVTVPPDFPEPTFADTSASADGMAILLVEGVEQLGAVVARYRGVVCTPPPFGEEAPECGTRTAVTTHLQDTTRRADGTYRVAIDWGVGLNELVIGRQEFVSEILSARVTVASVSEDWPDFEGRSVLEQREAPQPPPGINTNIEQGTGYLGGAVTKTVTIPTDLQELIEDD